MLNKTKRTIYHRDRDKVNEDVPDSDCIQDSSGPAPGGRRQPGRISPPPRPVHPVPGNDSPGPGRPGPAAPSRGGLIRNFLEGPGGRPNPRRIAVAGEEPLQRSAPRGGTNALPSRWTGVDRAASAITDLFPLPETVPENLLLPGYQYGMLKPSCIPDVLNTRAF